ncbi:CDGSH iron-sulfur domain-containing protein [Rhodococcoides corynebacterioides]
MPELPDRPGRPVDTAPRDARRVRVVPGGPVMVEGPVDVELEDGTSVRSDRFMVALCACRRSKNYPFCDTSHRRKVRAARENS